MKAYFNFDLSGYHGYSTAYQGEPGWIEALHFDYTPSRNEIGVTMELDALTPLLLDAVIAKKRLPQVHFELWRSAPGIEDGAYVRWTASNVVLTEMAQTEIDAEYNRLGLEKPGVTKVTLKYQTLTNQDLRSTSKREPVAA